MSEVQTLVEALFAGDAPRVKAILDENPQLASQRPSSGVSPLLAAAYTRNPALVTLVRSYVDSDLYEAAALGDVNALRARLDAHPEDISSYSGDGWTALHLAAFFGHEPAVSLVLERGANPLAVSKSSETNQPLHAALSGADSFAIVSALLNAGADPSAAAAGGVRPLHVAASRGDSRTVDALLARGADPRHRTTDGRTASVIATERGFPELSKLLSRAEQLDP
jgi:ankyrin repeat protein